MKLFTLLLVALGLVSCNGVTSPARNVFQHRIDGVVKGITNCYQKNNELVWHSGDKTADLLVSGSIQDGHPKCLVTTQINKYERIEVWFMKYALDGIHKGETEYKTLDFMVIEYWDDRIKAKKFWPWPKKLLFSIDTKDYRITNIE